jgi:hypothetical protein
MGRPRNPEPASTPMPWDKAVIAEQVQGILDALEVPQIDLETRRIFQKIIYRQELFGGDARGKVILTLRCILESSGNEGALIGPIVRAVSSCLTPSLPTAVLN